MHKGEFIAGRYRQKRARGTVNYSIPENISTETAHDETSTYFTYSHYPIFHLRSRVESSFCLALVTAAGLATEYFFEKSRNGKPTDSILVSCFLFTLILPVTVPYWIAAVGIIFAVIFGKQVFGGFARNVFNPAILGRVFVFISFPAAMTNSWTQPFTGFPGGFVKWAPELTDGISSTTPWLQLHRAGHFQAICKCYLVIFPVPWEKQVQYLYLLLQYILL